MVTDNVPEGPFDIRVDERTADGWKPLLYVEHRSKERALRDFWWATHDVRYGPDGTRKMTLLGPDRTKLPDTGYAWDAVHGVRVVDGPAL